MLSTLEVKAFAADHRRILLQEPSSRFEKKLKDAGAAKPVSTRTMLISDDMCLAERL